MRALVRTAAVAAGLAAALVPAASTQAASLFRGTSGGESIEVHADSRKIFYLHMEGSTTPINCTSAASVGEAGGLADTRIPIRLDPQTGAFSYENGYGSQTESDGVVIRGTIRDGRLRGEYEFSSTNSVSGETTRSTGDFSLSRCKGLRFYEDSNLKQRRSATTYTDGVFPHAVYMWIGNGKAYALTAIVNETCVHAGPGYPPFQNYYDLVLTRPRTAVNQRTHEIHVREVERTAATGQGNRQVWTLSADVGRREVSGHLSHTYDYTYAGGGDTLHCQTGSRADPQVDFAAFHR